MLDIDEEVLEIESGDLLEESGDVSEELEDIETPEVSTLNPLEILENDTKRVAEEIVKEQNIEKVKDLTNLFNLNNQKKNVLRILTYNDIEDIVIKQISDRLHKHPDEISNKELMEMLTVLQNCIEKSQKTIKAEEIKPLINISKTEINVNGGDAPISKASRDRILDVVDKIMKEAEIKKDNVIEVDTSEKEKEIK